MVGASLGVSALGENIFRIGAVVDHGTRNRKLNAILQDRFHRFANTDNRRGLTVHVNRNSGAPLCCRRPFLEARIESVQPVDSHNKRHVKALSQKRRGMSTGQSGMSMNDVDGILPVQPADVRQQATR